MGVLERGEESERCYNQGSSDGLVTIYTAWSVQSSLYRKWRSVVDVAVLRVSFVDDIWNGWALVCLFTYQSVHNSTLIECSLCGSFSKFILTSPSAFGSVSVY